MFYEKIKNLKGVVMEDKKRMFVFHNCKNSKKPEYIYTKDSEGKILSKVINPEYCNNGWVGEDRTNVKTYPPTYLYCPECEKKGFKNPKTRQTTRTPEQIEAFKQRMAEYRAKNG